MPPNMPRPLVAILVCTHYWILNSNKHCNDRCFITLQKALKSFSAWAPPQTPLGELTTLPHTHLLVGEGIPPTSRCLCCLNSRCIRRLGPIWPPPTFQSRSASDGKLVQRQQSWFHLLLVVMCLNLNVVKRLQLSNYFVLCILLM